MFSGDTNEAVEGLFQPIHAKQMARVEQSTTSSSSSRDYDKQNNIDTASVWKINQENVNSWNENDSRWGRVVWKWRIVALS